MALAQGYYHVGKSKLIIAWFRNDLRLHDNEMWFRAYADGEFVLPLFIFDPAWFCMLPLGFPKTGSFRAQFLLESVEALKRNLQSQGSDLAIRVGNPAEVFRQLLKEFKADGVYTSAHATDEEINSTKSVQLILSEQAILLHTFHTSTLIHPHDLDFSIDELPEIFTSFRKKVEKNLSLRAVFDIPEPKPIPTKDIGNLPDLQYFKLELTKIDPRNAVPYQGGESEATRRLQEYIWEKQLIATYKETRNGLIGSDYSSKFSPALAHGCISTKAIYHEVKKFEQEVIANESTYWLIFELLWRDYFHFAAMKYGNKIFKRSGLNNKSSHHRDDLNLFERWRSGQTGNDFVDANMRELLHTGFMSNRGRQNVASYLVHDLNLDWTWGATWFESQLIDYDPCSNWLNWAYVVGVGNDPRDNRYFNTKSQAERYDLDGAYRRLWLDS